MNMRHRSWLNQVADLCIFMTKEKHQNIFLKVGQNQIICTCHWPPHKSEGKIEREWTHIRLISVTHTANRSIFPSKQNNFAGGGTAIVTRCAACLPGHDDEEVQAVPGVSQVTATAKDPKSHHLYDHLQSEEDVDEGIKGLQGDAEWQQAVRKDAEETIRLDTFHSWRELILLVRIK